MTAARAAWVAARAVGRVALTVLLAALITLLLARRAPTLDEPPDQLAAPRQRAHASVLARLGAHVSGLARFDLGRSEHDGRRVSSHLAEALPPTLLLITLALALAYAAGIPAGAFAAARPRHLGARAIGAAAFLCAALPLFVAASLALRTLASTRALALFPPGGLHHPDSSGLALIPDVLYHLVLPAACLAYGAFALATAQQRTAIAAALAADHARAARAQGLPERRIVTRAIREAAPQLAALAAVQLPQLCAGAVIVERVFDLPGLGSLILGAIDHHDEPLLLGAVTVTALLAALALALADLLRRALDPRQREDAR